MPSYAAGNRWHPRNQCSQASCKGMGMCTWTSRRSHREHHIQTPLDVKFPHHCLNENHSCIVQELHKKPLLCLIRIPFLLHIHFDLLQQISPASNKALESWAILNIIDSPISHAMPGCALLALCHRLASPAQTQTAAFEMYEKHFDFELFAACLAVQTAREINNLNQRFEARCGNRYQDRYHGRFPSALTQAEGVQLRLLPSAAKLRDWHTRFSNVSKLLSQGKEKPNVLPRLWSTSLRL